MSSEDGPLSRWSRRKAEARQKRGSAAPAIEEPPQSTPPAEAPASQDSDAPPPDLPEIDSLTAESDFAQFMREGVPKHLRTLALRKLWASDPAFNLTDGMVEYGEDFTDGGALIANLKEVLEDAKGKTGDPKADHPKADEAVTDDVADAEADAESMPTDESDPAQPDADAAAGLRETDEKTESQT